MVIIQRTLKSNHIANAHTSAHGNKTKYMSIRPEVLYGSDFETNKPRDGVVNVWLWSIVRASDGAYIVGESIEEWYNEVMKLTGIVCFHNLKFDGQFIMDYLLRNNIPFCVEKTIIDPKMHIPYRIALKDDLFIQDTMRVHAGSLESVAESYGLEGKSEKADFSIFHEYGQYTDKEVEYVKQDSNIVAQILKLDCIANDGYIALTGAGFAKRQYVNWLKTTSNVAVSRMGKGMGSKPDEILNQLFPESDDGFGWDELSRMSYFGGLCLLKSGVESQVNGKTYVYDVNSAYPYQMCQRLPYGEPIACPVEYNYNPNVWGVYDVQCSFDVEGACPIIHKSRALKSKTKMYSGEESDNLVAIYGSSDYLEFFSGEIVLSTHEIEYLKKYGGLEIERVYEGYEFDTRDDLFAPYINAVYEERQSIKKSNPVKAGFLKLCMNALYGKFGSGEKHGIEYSINEKGLYTEAEKLDEIDIPWHYCPVASCITSLERVYIATIISENWDGFLYTDTDSVHLCQPHNEGTMRIHQRDLGALKCESIADQSKYIRPKCYVHINEREYDNEGNETDCTPIAVKCGGMPSTIKKTIKSMDELYIGACFPPETEKLTSDNGKLMPKKYIGGVYLEPTRFNLNDNYRM